MDPRQMVWDHNAHTIVLLTPVDEANNWPKFWPSDHDDFDSENWKVCQGIILFLPFL